MIANNKWLSTNRYNYYSFEQGLGHYVYHNEDNKYFLVNKNYLACLRLQIII